MIRRTLGISRAKDTKAIFAGGKNTPTLSGINAGSLAHCEEFSTLQGPVMYPRFSFILALVLLSLFSAAQRLRFRNISIEEGLSSGQVKCIMQDQLGFMWFGTSDGLNRYDGYKFRTYRNDPGLGNSINSSDVGALLQVRNDLIVAGTALGIACFDPFTEKFTHPFSGEARLQQKITSLFRLDDRTILAGTQGGLFKLDLQTGKLLKSYFPDLLKVNITCIMRTWGQVYVGTGGNGLWRINQADVLEKVEIQHNTPVSFNDLFQLRDITHLQEYGGKLYVGSRQGAVLKVDTDHELLTSFNTGNGGEVRDFVIWNNHLYCATSAGLSVYNLLNGKFSRYTRQDPGMGIGSDLLRCIKTDAANNFWIGTDDSGVSISLFRSQKFPMSALQYETQFRDIFSLNSAVPGKLLIGGKNTLSELDLQTGEVLALNGKLTDYTVLSLAIESPQWIWAGTTTQGLLRVDRQKGTVSVLLDALRAPDITSLLIHNKVLYAGTMGAGLFAVDLATGQIRQYTETDGLPELNINNLFVDEQGRFWIAGNSGGAFRLQKAPGAERISVEKIYRNTGKRAQLASNTVFAINEDKKGDIWMATSAGLSKLLPGDTFCSYYGKDGLSNTFIYTMERDSMGHFWCSTNGGLIRFDPAASVREVVFKNYNLKDGLLNNEFARGASHAAPDGTLFFGGAAGFNMFRPGQIHDNLHAPEIYLTGYSRAGAELSTDTSVTFMKRLVLGWEENNFQLEFAAIDFTDPARNKFRYRLLGHDKEWSSPSTNRFISYNDLPGGTYTLQVKASNNDGIWNEKPLELSIRVVPPFWKTKIFYVAVILALFALVYLYTRIRTRAVMRENRLLEQKVAERTRELEQKNRDITSSIEYARRIQEAILPPAEHIFARLDRAFILYQPKDIVSGDFYWFSEQKGKRVFAVVDCTGHGVPGAFMSMIGHNLLHQIVNEKGLTDPGEILDQLHAGVRKALRQGQGDTGTNDGMDVSLIVIGQTMGELLWAGANRPLVVVDPGRSFKRFEGDKMPVGGAQIERVQKFTTHRIEVQPGSMCYMFTDGYADQFGGDRGKKFMVRRFHDLLAEIHLLSPQEQKESLFQSFEAWRQNHEQVDDVLIAGITV